MRILISLADIRQIKNVLFTPFFDEIRCDKKNDYIIITRKKYKDILCEKYKARNINYISYENPSLIQQKIYAYASKICDFNALKKQRCNDHKIFLNRLYDFDKINFHFLNIMNFMQQFFEKKIKILVFNKIFKLKYNIGKIDKILLTTYHVLEEWQLIASYPKVDKYFFTDGWDAFTKQTNYIVPPNKVFAWSDRMRELAVRNCNFCPNIVFTAYPFYDNLYSNQNLISKSILAFDTNLRIYNIVDVVKKIYHHISKNSSYKLKIRCSPISSSKYILKYLEYDKIIGKENVLRIDDWRHTKNITKESIVNEYIDMLNNNDIFILFTASTVIYDILRTGKPVIIVFIRGNDERKWDATKAIDREVLLEFNNSPLVHLVENIVEFGIVLQKVISNKNKTKFCFNSSSNTKKFYKEIIS